jgi:hypothetical protein
MTKGNGASVSENVLSVEDGRASVLPKIMTTTLNWRRQMMWHVAAECRRSRHTPLQSTGEKLQLLHYFRMRTSTGRKANDC